MNARRSFQFRRPEPTSTGVLDQFLPEDGRSGLEDAPRAFEVTNDDSLDRVRSMGRSHHVRTRRTILGAAVCVAALGVLTVVWIRSTGWGAGATKGVLNVQSEPGNATVFIDGQANGTTPVSLTLPSGTHRLVLRRGELSQELSVTVAQNVSIVHHFTWPSQPGTSAATGSLRVTTEGPAGVVSVDKLRRGSTPLTVSLRSGDHDVVVVRDGTTYHRTIRVEPGATASLVIGGSTTAGPESGWLAASAAAPLQILEDGKLVGTTASERILMPAGEHIFEFSDAALGFEESRTVKIVAGRAQNVSIELPEVPISINATPWAEAWLDGRSLGQTPIGNITTTIGSHEVVLRHPQLGERRITAVVTMKEAARVAVDMRRSQ
jgi:PEGA domain-containing protein